MKERLDSSLATDALRMALWRRRPGGSLAPLGSGVQYASGEYQAILAEHAMVCSMSRKADCWDNAVAELSCPLIYVTSTSV